MKKFLIDANLPAKIKIWQANNIESVVKINDEWTDSEIWDYALDNGFIIVTKDSDFSHRVMVSKTSPKIIHIQVGNLRLMEFEIFIERIWTDVTALCEKSKIVNVFTDRIETVG